MAGKETPRWTPDTHTNKHALDYRVFAINLNAWEDDGEGGCKVGRRRLSEMQKSGTGYRNESDIKTKAHTIISYQKYGTIVSALDFDWRRTYSRACKYGKGSPYFLAQMGSDKLVCSVSKTLFIDSLECVWQWIRARGSVVLGFFFLLYVEKSCSEWEWHFFLTLQLGMLPGCFCYYTLQLTNHLYTVYLPPVCKLPGLSPGLVDTVTSLYTPYW